MELEELIVAEPVAAAVVAVGVPSEQWRQSIPPGFAGCGVPWVGESSPFGVCEMEERTLVPVDLWVELVGGRATNRWPD